MLLLAVFLLSPLFVCSVTSQEGIRISCSEENTVVTGHDTCGSGTRGVSHLCQAVIGCDLNLTCSNCPLGITVEWAANGSLLSGTDRLLVLRDGTYSAGCYSCSCMNSSVGMNFTVELGYGEPPNFAVNHTLKPTRDHKPPLFAFSPEWRKIILFRNDSGQICINATAVGYPDPQYNWYYKGGGKVHDLERDPCLHLQDNNKQLCITPSLSNARDGFRIYYCEVSNLMDEIFGYQEVSLDIRDWIIHDHPNISKGVMHLTDGTASGQVVAYDECGEGNHHCLTYTLCVVTDTDLKRIRDFDNLGCTRSLASYAFLWEKCCQCGYNLTAYGLHTKLINGDSVTTSSVCSFTVNSTGNILFFGQQDSYGSLKFVEVSNARLQYLGKVSVENQGNAGSVLSFVLYVCGAFIAGCSLVVCILCFCSCCWKIMRACLRRKKGNRQQAQMHQAVNYGTFHERQEVPHVRLVNRGAANVQGGRDVRCVAQVQGERMFNYDVGTLDLQYAPTQKCLQITVAGKRVNVQMELPAAVDNVSPPVLTRHLIPREPHAASICALPDFQMNVGSVELRPLSTNHCLQLCFAGKTIALQMELKQAISVEESLTNSCKTGQEIAKRVQARQTQLVQSLKIDAMLLAAINKKELLIQSDTEKLQAMLDNKTARCDIASHFVNNVLFHWSPNFFKYQLRALADALANHDDQGNNQVAELFRRILSEFRTPDSSPPTSLEGFVDASDKPFQPKTER